MTSQITISASYTCVATGSVDLSVGPVQDMIRLTMAWIGNGPPMSIFMKGSSSSMSSLPAINKDAV
jgi:hypothetical protein